MSDNSSVDKYIEWVLNKIEQIQIYTSKLNKKDININDIKEVVSQRLHVTNILNSEYQRYRTQLTVAKRNYNIWWSTRFTEKRRELNPSSLPGSKWSSKNDIDAEIISSYKEEYIKYQEHIDFLEERTSFLRRLMTDWNSISFDCNSLIKLLEMEVYQLSMISEDNTKQRRQRSTN